MVQHLQGRFSGVYAFVNQSDKEQAVEFKLLFPTTQAIYDNLTFNVDGNPVAVSNQKNAALTVVKSALVKLQILQSATVRRV